MGETERPADLSQCAAEPIHIPGAIQPYGVLLVADPASLTVLQAGVGSWSPDAGPADFLGKTLADVLPASAQGVLDRLPAVTEAQGAVHLGAFDLPDGSGGERSFHAIAHRSGGALVLELEAMTPGEPGSFKAFYPSLQALLSRVEAADSIETLSETAADVVRRVTGLDRVLVYRFDENWNGEVLAESRNDVLPSYLGLRFPASDIPAQARELYRRNRLRLIRNADYRPARIEPTNNPLTGRPIDLSSSVLRSVSPVHLEYMRNMGTGASMSVSLLREDRLWGLISCHNQTPHSVPFHVRAACDLIGQMLSLQLSAREHASAAERRGALRAVQARLLAHMAAEESFRAGLVRNPDELLQLTGAAGAAVVSDGVCDLVGETPSSEAVMEIVAWLKTRQEEVFSTSSLAAIMPGAEAVQGQASGVLAVSLSQVHASYLLWFRPEVVRTVRWGGDPTAKPTDDAMRIHPRKSFETWRETVRGRAAPWDEAELQAAAELRSAIVDIVLRQAEETAALSEELARSNKELEAFSYSVSHDLRAPFRHVVGYAELLKLQEGDKLSERGHRYIDTIIESAVSAGTLVDSLLSYSQIGRATLGLQTVDMNQLVAQVRRLLEVEHRDRRVEWRVSDLPPACADPVMARVMVQNLLQNAVKFTKERDPAVIEVGAVAAENETVYWVRDNGTGFDMAYAGKLFGVFQRLHRAEEFEGAGIGLANVKRIAERHGGRVWAEGALNSGATFSVALPNQAET